MKTPLDTRGSRANDGGSARLGKKQPDGTHAHRIAHSGHADFQPAELRSAPVTGPSPGSGFHIWCRRAARVRGVSPDCAGRAEDPLR